MGDDRDYLQRIAEAVERIADAVEDADAAPDVPALVGGILLSSYAANIAARAAAERAAVDLGLLAADLEVAHAFSKANVAVSKPTPEPSPTQDEEAEAAERAAVEAGEM